MATFLLDTPVIIDALKKGRGAALMDLAVAGHFNRIYSGRGVTLAIPDAIVAAVAVENGLALITDNAKDFPMPELSLLSLPDR